MSSGKMLHKRNFMRTDFIKIRGNFALDEHWAFAVVGPSIWTSEVTFLLY